MEHRIAHVRSSPSKDVSIFFFGDMQGGSSAHCQPAWDQFRDEFMRTRNAYAIGLGDYDDFTRPSLRPAIRTALGRDESAALNFDKIVLKYNDQTIKSMSFLEGHLLGLHEGHHNWTLSSGINTDQRIASALKTSYLGFVASLRLIVNQDTNSRGTSIVYTIVSTHGNANGRKVHSALAWLEGNICSAMIADQYVCGHGAKNASETPHERLIVRRRGSPGVERKLPRLLVVGGFTQSYTDGWHSDYVQRAGFSPQPPGWGCVKLRLVNNKGNAISKQSGHGVASWGLDVEQTNRHPVVFSP